MTLWQLFKLGGIFMYPLLAFFVLMVYAIIERAIYFILFCWDTKIDTNKANATSKSQFVTKITALYNEFTDKPKEFELLCTNECNQITQTLKSNLKLLSLVATLAPITGFLGTVTGMIAAFRSITQAVNVSTQLVAGGIYEALITTAVGLIISIIASIFYFFYNGLVSRYICKMEKSVNDIIKNQYKSLCSCKK